MTPAHHRREIGPYLERMRTADIASVMAEDSEVVEERVTRSRPGADWRNAAASTLAGKRQCEAGASNERSICLDPTQTGYTGRSAADDMSA
jgi:hypothetical protein